MSEGRTHWLATDRGTAKPPTALGVGLCGTAKSVPIPLLLLEFSLNGGAPTDRLGPRCDTVPLTHDVVVLEPRHPLGLFFVSASQVSARCA